MTDKDNSYEMVVDAGIEKGCEKLTNERITAVINTIMKSETGARLKAYMNTCVKCGLCSEACHFFYHLKKILFFLLPAKSNRHWNK